MPTYDNPMTLAYNFPNMDFGATAGTTVHRICGPTGKQGFLREVLVTTSEATIFATTPGIVEVGSASDPDAYAKLNIPTATAINTAVGKRQDPDAIIQPKIAANAAVIVTLTEGTGAGLTGQGAPIVIIDWF